MSLLHLNLDAITEADLSRLVVDSIHENKTLEYKLELSYCQKIRNGSF